MITFIQSVPNIPYVPLASHSEYLNLYDNQFTGTIPNDLRLSELYYFDVGRNNVSTVSGVLLRADVNVWN
jgi:Leucine-rich repeat (LRR) protein